MAKLVVDARGDPQCRRDERGPGGIRHRRPDQRHHRVRDRNGRRDHVAAELELGVVNGDVRLRNVAGAVSLEEAKGDFRGRELPGGLITHQVRGSLTLKTHVTSGAAYRAQAQGDISARFAPESSARFARPATRVSTGT